MASKRHLPVLQSNPSVSSAQSSSSEQLDELRSHPWHWVPLGTLASLLFGAVLARSFYVPYQQRAVEAVYGAVTSREAFLRVDATLSQAARDQLQLRLSLAGMLVAFLAIALGGFVITRFGEGTNRRHGTLSGLTTMSLLVLLLGRSLTFSELFAFVLVVVLGALAGYLGALGGEVLRARSA